MSFIHSTLQYYLLPRPSHRTCRRAPRQYGVAGQLKVGAFARSECMAKWNEALRIEEQCAGRSHFAGASALAGR